jgi:WD40-like Beta Propeller Repeat
MRIFAICLLGLVVGCATTKDITITSNPPGAVLEVDNQSIGKAPQAYKFVWENDNDIHYVNATLDGYRVEPVQMRKDYDKDTLNIQLKPVQKRLTIDVEPVPGLVKLNGKLLSPKPVSQITTDDLDFNRNVQTGEWAKYTITAERRGFQTATTEAVAGDKDGSLIYQLILKPQNKEINVTTTPPGATVYFDDEQLGASPVKGTRDFPYDVDKDDYVKHKLRASAPGYPDQSIDIAWDEAKADYHIDMLPFTKVARIHTAPPGGVVTLDGNVLKQDEKGDSLVRLSFPPLDDKGTLKTYSGTITKETEVAKWYPMSFTMAWDDGKTDYVFPLREIRTVSMPLLQLMMTRGGSGWTYGPQTVQTIASKDVNERSGLVVERLTPNEVKGQQIDSLSISPDGKRLLFSVLMEKPDFRSLIYTMPADGSGPPELVNDGKSLDVTPCFSPDGQQILFSSDRAGNRLSVWAISATGALGAQQFTQGDTNDLWPCLDSSPKTRLFYEAFTDRLADPIIFSRPIDGNSRMDLGVDDGRQPRINPKNDSVLYCAYNAKTHKRDIFKVGDRGSGAVNLTNTLDADEYDAIWDQNGGKIAYASDAGLDEDKRHNADIWVLDLTQSNARPVQVTANASQDDRPVWDPTGRAIYFRSNRGTEWGIWKVTLK